MDVKEVLENVLKAENVSAITKSTGAKSADVKKVLKNGLPFIADSANAGKSQDQTIKAIATKAGTDEKSTGSILSSALPLISNLLGGGSSEETEEEKEEAGSSLISSLTGLLGNLDLGDILSLISGDDDEETTTASSGKKKKKKSDSSPGLGSILSLIGGIFGK